MVAIKINFVIIARIVMQNFCCDFCLGAASQHNFIDPHLRSIMTISSDVQSYGTDVQR